MTRSPEVLRDTEALLEEEGHRVTLTRRAVLKVIAESPAPLTAEDISDEVPEIGRATVFRTVKLLHELGVVCRVTMENGGVRYVMAAQEHHHHLVCSTCGTVREFACPQLDQAIQAEARNADFELHGHTVELYGICSDCRR